MGLQDIVEKLQHKSAELESIIAHMLNGLIAVDGQLHVVQMNGAAKHMLGVTGNVEGKHVLEATGNSRLEAGLQEAMEHEELFTLELPVRAAPRHRLIRLYISPLEHEDESIGAVALLEDITELRNLEQMRTDFAANVTHELKTPLTSIRGFVETLQAGAIEDPEMAKRFLDIISMETDRLSRLINDVLSLSSMENGRVRVPTERLSLGKRAGDVCLMLDKSAKNKNIELNVDEGEDTFIIANDDHVKQLLQPAGFARFSFTTAEAHDEMIAFTSQMAHVVSNAYIKSPTASQHKGFSAGSYKDMTRVAWLSPEMWAELFLENKDNLLHELDMFMTHLGEYRDAMARDDLPALTRLLDEGRRRKEEVDGR